MGIPLVRIYSAATFYKAFSLTPKGKYRFQVCTGTACHVKGARRLLDGMKRDLDIEEGMTTTDGLFSIESVRCIGCCSLAPAVVVNDKTYGRSNQVKVTKLVKSLRSDAREEAAS